MPSKHAVLLTGLLRCIEYTVHDLISVVADRDLFVVTDSSQSDQVALLRRHVKTRLEVVYSDKLAPWNAFEDALSHLDRGGMIRQWLKLSLGRSLILKQEEASNVQYSCIYRMRSDLLLEEHSAFASADHLEKPQHIFMRSDYVFGGSRAAFLTAASFFDVLFSNYYARTEPLLPERFDLLEKSEPGAGPYNRLSYPKFLPATNDAFELLENVRRYSSDLQEAKFPSEEIRTPDNPNWAVTQIFPSEPAFLHYINASGLIASSALGFVPRLIGNRMNHEILTASVNGNLSVTNGKLESILVQQDQQGRLSEAVEFLEQLARQTGNNDNIQALLEKYQTKLATASDRDN